MATRLPAAATRIGFLLVVGCGSPPAPPDLVSGRVTVNGIPAERATVRFFPAGNASGEAVLPTAVVTADGSFRVARTHPSFGLPPGDYVVTVVWPEYVRQGGEEVEGKDRLGGRYGTPQHPAAKVTLKDGPNPLPPFDLKKS